MEYGIKLTSNPKDDKAFYNLGVVYGRKGDFKTALKYLLEGTSINPKDDKAFYSLGLINYKRGEIITAINYFKKAIYINPQRTEAYLGLIERKGEAYEGKFQPLIDKATFETVQRILNERARPRKSKKQLYFPFRGMFKCAECGGQITAQFAKGNGGTYRYYRCSKKFGTCKQGYLREDLLVQQLKEQFLKIAIPNDWAENMLKEIERWQKDEQLKTKTKNQNTDLQFKNIEGKMDKLVNGYLEGEIEKTNYLKKKDELLKQKSDLKLKSSDFGQKGGQGWVEPLRDWVKSAHYARKLANSDMDLSQYKELSDKTGSNRLLKDKKIVFDWLPPFDIVAKDRELQTEKTKSPDHAGLKKTGKKKRITDWRRGRDLNPRYPFRSTAV